MSIRAFYLGLHGICRRRGGYDITTEFRQNLLLFSIYFSHTDDQRSTEITKKGPHSLIGYFVVHLASGPAGDLAYAEPQGQCAVQPADLLFGVIGKNCLL